MIRFSDIRIRFRLVLLLVFVGAIPLLVVSLVGSRLTTDALMEKSFNQLITVQSIRKGEIEDFFTTSFSRIRILAESERIQNMMSLLLRHKSEMKHGRSLIDDAHSLQYQVKFRSFMAPLKKYINSYGYHDLFLVDADGGDVLYSLAREEDLGTNLKFGQYRNSGLGVAWKRAVTSGKTTIVDFSSYAPSGGAEAAFIAEPVRDGYGKAVGVVILQLTPQLITHVVDSRQGMGETGESYIVGVNLAQNKYEFRSNLRTMGNGDFVVGYSLTNPLDYWKDAASSGESGGHSIYIDSAGEEVLVAYNELNIAGLRWFLISKINKYEVTAPIRHTYKYIGALSGLLLFLVGGLAVFFSRTITRPIIADMQFAHAIAEGNLDATIDVDQKDELGDLARSLEGMARNLRELDWLKSGKEGLDDTMRGEHSPQKLARISIAYLCKHMGAQLGAVYALEDGALELIASYAFSDRKGNFNRFVLGEGMVGQAALENELLIFSNITEDAPAVNYGAGEACAKAYMAVPVAFEGEIVGVILLGAMENFSPLHRKFIEQNVENIAILMNAAQSRQLVHELLEQAQQQQEELRATNEELEEQTEALIESEARLQQQQEELRVTNEELEEQTTVLKESQSELQVQQEELRVINEELEERTQALEEQKSAIAVKNSELVKAQNAVKQKAKDLEVASKYKSEFLANMSHELRTPLNSILILSQLFGHNKDGNLTDKQIESANAIHSSGSDLLTLINEILDLSKIEAGKVELIIEPVGVSNLIQNINRLYKDIAADKDVAFDVSVASDAPEALETDSQRLQQVLRNLLTNAFKFTHKGSVSLTIARPSQELTNELGIDASKAVSFAVSDDGIGIPKDKQIAIFQAFQQADGSTSRNYGGTGLGLSISRELVRLLQGAIYLESEEGKGSTFTVVLPEFYQDTSEQNQILSRAELPLASGGESYGKEAATFSVQENSAVSQPVITQTVASSQQSEAPSKKTIVEKVVPTSDSEYVEDDRAVITPDSRSLLIIEDDWNFAKIMRDFGRERGFQCLVAEDGESGLYFADYYKPSAIILDVGLPGIDGWTVMERLKDNPELRHIPVHFMSANDNSLDALRMGAIGYLSKPVTMEHVEDAFSALEDVISQPVRNLLLVEDDKIQCQSIQELIGNDDVKITDVATGREAYEELSKGSYDCMILDLGLEDMSGFELLEKIRVSDTSMRVPVIIYTGRDLTRDEEKQLSKYTESIIIKGVKSPERLLDETALFLHRVESNLPQEKRQMLKMVHDKESVLSGKKVMVVDDDMRNVFALSSVLEDRNMDVIVAKNGLECLEKLEELDSIDCVLMDIMMPKMDGYEAMTEIRKNPQYAKLPIIALTAKAMKGDRSKCIDAGASDYLSKPVNTDKLISMMRVWLY
ncbi:response regulator [Halodesulfovibrio marinisediminis]|uniref:histidine kinase n=1 Tax=Halodesulfovibrio marinisediminis DSM 17456 TaxID=1121457 RepID=A0A1N6GXN7_9BACT|nr:response regulator [Halodesulfovibrio marinisediminis]SIO12135.1 signal transduction histidine kinase [Halodesulfovibrio marinisediminis DSM 17456]